MSAEGTADKDGYDTALGLGLGLGLGLPLLMVSLIAYLVWLLALPLFELEGGRE